MKISINLLDGTISVEDAEDLKRLSARVIGEGDLDATLSDFAFADGPEHLWVNIAALGELASQQVQDRDGWMLNYNAMIAYAQRSGWVDAASTSVRVHIAWMP